MTMNIIISEQRIHTDVRKITANSINYLTACCHFDKDWSEVSKQIIFTNGNVSKAVIVSDGEVFKVPYEVLVPGKLELSAVGLDDNGEKRITTRKMLLSITVYPSGELTGDTQENYTPELWEQVCAQIGDLGNLNTKAENIVEAINAVKNIRTSLTKETDPTVPSWAKADSKPSYTAEEVGAVALEEGKGLSANDYTNEDKSKLDALPEVVIVTFSGTSTGSKASMSATQIFQANRSGKIVYAQLGTELYLLSFANPQSAQFYGLRSAISSGGIVITGTALQQVVTSRFQTVENKVTELSESSTDTQYPSAKCVYGLVGNIKTLIDNL